MLTIAPVATRAVLMVLNPASSTNHPSFSVIRSTATLPPAFMQPPKPRKPLKSPTRNLIQAQEHPHRHAEAARCSGPIVVRAAGGSGGWGVGDARGWSGAQGKVPGWRSSEPTPWQPRHLRRRAQPVIAGCASGGGAEWRQHMRRREHPAANRVRIQVLGNWQRSPAR